MDERQGEEDAASVSGLENSASAGAAQQASASAQTAQSASARDASAPAKAKASKAASHTAKTRSPGQLTSAEEQLIAKLRARDTSVRAHEAAHQGAGGGLVGGATFSYETGPDGRQYAIGGEVPVDTSPVSNDPEATISKEERVRAAALAPADPSSQDYSVAAQAAQIVAMAQMEAASRRAQESSSKAAITPAKATSSAFRIYGHYGRQVASGLDLRA